MSTTTPIRFVIVGGVAAGASAAARARRLSESAQITVVERGQDVSFANCGLPYFIGGEIASRASLAVQTPQTLHALLNLDVRTGTEVVAIDRVGKRVQISVRETGATGWLPYDKLLLAPGATPVRPALPGIDDARIFTLRTMQDMDRIKTAAATAQRIAVIGAGFIGLEMTEQFVRLGKHVTLVEIQDQVLPPLDRPMTLLVEDELRRHGVELILGDAIDAFECDAGVTCRLKSSRAIDADLVVLSIGVRPESGLVRGAGLTVGSRGHVRVNSFLQTDDRDIYAAGDVAETEDFINGEPKSVALGGPANRQGRVVADHIFLGAKARPYPGSLGTAIVRVFDVAAGLTGWTEKRLKTEGMPYRVATVGDNHHASYYPGAKPLTLRLLWEPHSSRVLGAQVAGFEGVDKRLDVIATAIVGGLTIDDLTHLDLSYAPPFGAAKDLVNLAGFTACNVRDGLVDLVDEIPADPSVQVLDARPLVLAKSHPISRAAGTINIPLGELRQRLGELDRTRPTVTVCAIGKTSYFASRILCQNGFSVRSFNGGIRANLDPRTPPKPPAPK